MGNRQSDHLDEPALVNFPFATPPAPLLWREAETGADGPSPRSGHACVFFEHRMYVYGGYHADHGCFHELWSLSLVTGRWIHHPVKWDCEREGRASPSVVVVGDKLYIFGGSGARFGSSNHNSLLMINLRTFEGGAVITNGAPPRERYGQSMVVVYEQRDASDDGYTFDDGDRHTATSLLLHGGTNGIQFFFDLHELDLSTMTWTKLKAVRPPGDMDDHHPPASYRHESFFWRGRLYVLGGGAPEPNHIMDSMLMDHMYVWDPHTSQWSTIDLLPGTPPDHAQDAEGGAAVDSDEEFEDVDEDSEAAARAAYEFPAQRRAFVSVVSGDRLYIHGGVNQSTVLGDLWCLDLIEQQWTRIVPKGAFPTSRFFHCGCINPSDGALVLFGGSLFRPLDPLARAQRVNDSHVVFLRVPSLLTLAADALARHFPLSQIREVPLPHSLHRLFH